eukprot:6185008-Pleurochrysis_carterae.AAC.1
MVKSCVGILACSLSNCIPVLAKWFETMAWSVPRARQSRVGGARRIQRKRGSSSDAVVGDVTAAEDGSVCLPEARLPLATLRQCLRVTKR